MEYTTIEIRVPVGYEKQVTDLVMMKIEGILSQALLQPSEQKKAEFATEVLKAKHENRVL